MTHHGVGLLGVRGHLEVFVNKGIQELLSQTSGDAGIDRQGKLGTAHSGLCHTRVDTAGASHEQVGHTLGSLVLAVRVFPM